MSNKPNEAQHTDNEYQTGLKQPQNKTKRNRWTLDNFSWCESQTMNFRTRSHLREFENMGLKLQIGDNYASRFRKGKSGVTASRGLSCFAQQKTEPAEPASAREFLFLRPHNFHYLLSSSKGWDVILRRNVNKNVNKETQLTINTQSHLPRVSVLVFKVSFAILKKPQGKVNKNEGSGGKIGFIINCKTNEVLKLPVSTAQVKDSDQIIHTTTMEALPLLFEQ